MSRSYIPRPNNYPRWALWPAAPSSAEGCVQLSNLATQFNRHGNVWDGQTRNEFARRVGVLKLPDGEHNGLPLVRAHWLMGHLRDSLDKGKLDLSAVHILMVIYGEEKVQRCNMGTRITGAWG